MKTRFLLCALAFGCSGDTDAEPATDAAADTSADIADSQRDAVTDVAPDAPFVCPADTPSELTNAHLRADGGRLYDAQGRDVQLRGLNTGGRSKWEPFVPFPMPEPYSAEAFRDEARVYFARMNVWGLNAVRMPFSWEALEPTEGTYDQDYLDRYAIMVDVAWEHGLRVIVDFHQDVFASQFCGDGFPPWTVTDIFDGPARHDCADWFTRYLGDEQVAAAFDRFFEPEGELQAAFRAMWTEMANRFADHPGVLGFEIINEPHWGSNDAERWREHVLTPFYNRMAELLHELAPDKLVFYDSTGIDAVAPRPTHHRPEGEFLVYAPHLYDFGLLSGNGASGIDPGPQIDVLAGVRETYDIPILIGEFGFAHGARGGLEWLDTVMNSVDEHRIHTTLWEYSVADELWNEEDLSVVNEDGSEREILDVYVRPWLRDLSGTEATFEWHDGELVATATWISDGGVTEFAVPNHVTPGGQITTENENVCWFHDTGAETIRVWAPEGERVEVVLQMM